MQDAHLPAEGFADSTVRVVAFEDLQCPDCAAWRTMLDKRLLPKYAKRVAFETHDFPLPKHRWSEPAAAAARLFSAHSPEAGAAFRRYCYKELENISAESLPERVSDFAEREGYAAEEAVEALHNPVFLEAVRRDVAEGKRLGIEKTPTVLIGPKRFVEAFAADDIASAIESALANGEQQT